MGALHVLGDEEGVLWRGTLQYVYVCLVQQFASKLNYVSLNTHNLIRKFKQYFNPEGSSSGKYTIYM